MTEDEAKTKWCPMARIIDSDGSYNRESDGFVPSNVFCLASACMMWSWTLSAGYLKAHPDDPFYKDRLPEGDCGLKGGNVG
jgi:hypothetical protein